MRWRCPNTLAFHYLIGSRSRSKQNSKAFEEIRKVWWKFHQDMLSPGENPRRQCRQDCQPKDSALEFRVALAPCGLLSPNL